MRVRIATALITFCFIGAAHSGIFDDDEARRAILDLRQRIDSARKESQTQIADESRRTAEENAQLRRGLVELQNQIESLHSDQAKMRGQYEELSRSVSDLQRQQKDAAQGVDDRLRKMEPTKVIVDGREFLADSTEKRDFESALAVFRKGDFAAAQVAFFDFIRRYGQSGYVPAANFWLGNARYATRDYKEAILNF